jgi:hypothetical protein
MRGEGMRLLSSYAAIIRIPHYGMIWLARVKTSAVGLPSALLVDPTIRYMIGPSWA